MNLPDNYFDKHRYLELAIAASVIPDKLLRSSKSRIFLNTVGQRTLMHLGARRLIALPKSNFRHRPRQSK